MKQKKVNQGDSWKELKKDIIKRWPEIDLPGYWKNIEENCAQWSKEVTVGPVWSGAKKELSNWIIEHRTKTASALMSKESLPNFENKGIRRIKTKIKQKLLQEPEYGSEAFGVVGPAIPNLNDLVRTRISCQYIDGVEFIAKKLVQLCQNMGIHVKHKRKGSQEGYFAQHVIFSTEVFFRFMGQSEPVIINCEIQIATAMSTTIWDSTHNIYENAREGLDEPAEWQWNPKDPRFISRQIGHMIHLADGLLVGLREATFSKMQKGDGNEHK